MRKIRLESKGEMLTDVEFQSPAESIEVRPVRLLPSRRELTNHELRDRVGRVRDSDHLQRAQVRSHKEGDDLKNDGTENQDRFGKTVFEHRLEQSVCNLGELNPWLPARSAAY